MPDDLHMKEYRVRARMAWNNWPDTPEVRKRLEDRDRVDPVSAIAWDRVVKAILEYQNEEAPYG